MHPATRPAELPRPVSATHTFAPRPATRRTQLILDEASAILQNISLDASYQAAPGRRTLDGRYPSEIFVNGAGVLLNLTFGEVTGCHPNTIFYSAPPAPSPIIP